MQEDHNALLLRACTDIVAELIAGIKEGLELNLNGIKGRVCKRLKMSFQPRLVDIISAIPEEYRQALLPRMRAKPVRTASGIAVVAVMSKPHRYANQL
jgi:elongator complex protein 3